MLYRREGRRKQQGFSLIELLIVVAIILIIAAIAIPNLLHSKMSANEASAVGSLSTLNTTCITYSTIYGGYPHTLANLGPGTPATSVAADLIDSVLATGTKSGYVFAYSPGATDANGNVLTYGITAEPVSVGATGTRFFFTDQSGVIRANTTGIANVSSTPIS
jgi:prepilin-type N-terminal cleavage/methylation domain-containing protein